jgi:hypothetical protein
MVTNHCGHSASSRAEPLTPNSFRPSLWLGAHPKTWRVTNIDEHLESNIREPALFLTAVRSSIGDGHTRWSEARPISARMASDIFYARIKELLTP